MELEPHSGVFNVDADYVEWYGTTSGGRMFQGDLLGRKEELNWGAEDLIRDTL